MRSLLARLNDRVKVKKKQQYKKEVQVGKEEVQGVLGLLAYLDKYTERHFFFLLGTGKEGHPTLSHELRKTNNLLSGQGHKVLKHNTTQGKNTQKHRPLHHEKTCRASIQPPSPPPTRYLSSIPPQPAAIDRYKSKDITIMKHLSCTIMFEARTVNPAPPCNRATPAPPRHCCTSTGQANFRVERATCTVGLPCCMQSRRTRPAA